MKWTCIEKTNVDLGIGNDAMNKYLNHLGVTPALLQLLQNPPKEHDGNKMHDLPAFISSITQDVEDGLKLSIVGDYDCDGVTSTSIIYLTLKLLGADINYVVPHRVKDGYGLNPSIVQKLIQEGTQCIITVDNGIAAHEAVDVAKQNGCKVYITDHHKPSEVLPNADLIVHPALPGYPFAEISGATVAYKIGKEILKECRKRKVAEEKIHELEDYILQMAAISIVSDVMPVASLESEEAMSRNENRGLLLKGLDSMRTNPNWHLKILFDMMNVNYETMDETTIGFSVAPVINAVGRLDDAKEAIQFMTAETESECILKCSIMTYLNEERKTLKKQYLTEIEKLVDDSKPAIIIRHEVHEGLIGIIAGNLADQYQKPTIIFAPTTVKLDDGTEEKAWKASSRSNTISLYETLAEINTQNPELIYRFGGHAGAAGLTVLDKNYTDFETAFMNLVMEKNKNDTSEKFYQYLLAQDMVPFGECVATLKPFGNGFPKPIIKTTMLVTQIDVFNASKHVLLSNPFGNQLWLYGVLEMFKNAGLLDGFEEIMNNEQKLIVERGYTPDFAAKAKWQRFKAPNRDKNLKLEMLLEIDYGELNGKIQVQPRVLEYERKK